MTKKDFDLNKNLSKPNKTDLKAEKNKAEKSEDEKPVKDMISILDILKYSTGADYIFVLIGFLGSVATGSGWPVMTILFGNIVDVFVDFEVAYANATDANQPTEYLVQEFMNQIYLLSGLLLVVMAVFVVGNYANIHCFQMFSLRQMNEIKKRYFRSILRQEVAWYDKQSSGEFASRISSDFKKFESGINENLGLLIYNVTGCVVNLIVGLIYGWKLSLVIIAMAPIIGASSYIMTRLQSRYTQQELKSYSVASSVAEEAISAIRTVFAFSGQHKESSRYEKMLKPAMLSGCKRNIVTAIGNSISWGTLYASFALGIWYGVLLIINEPETYSIGVVVIVFWAITGTGYQIGYAAPYLESFQTARTAASEIYKVVERKSAIDSFSTQGVQLKKGYRADIEFRDVHFSYPTRPDVPVLQGLNLSICEGETVALVGASGCGKSTVIQLVQRFYEPDSGEVLLSGENISSVNAGWLRSQMGVVGQEPVLFDASVEENIRLGSSEEVSCEDIRRAAREANAHEFIGELQRGYQSYCGDRGAQLSGGQKQRIAIARALLSQPRILLLDEATSALDLRSEHLVQAALDRASEGRTTLIVAHRLSTIRHAHRIVLIDKGQVREMGTHEQLMELKGAYYALVNAQEVVETDSSNGHAKLDRTLSSQSAKPRPHGSTIGSTGSMSTREGSINFMEDVDEIDKEVLKKAEFPYFRVLKLILSDKLYFTTALVSALLYGLCTPIYALIFGSFVGEFSIGVEGHEEQLKAATLRYSIFFVALAVGMFLTNTLQISLFGIVGEKLTMKLRMMAFNAILNQDCAWFDEPTNSAGALCSRLANDAANVQGATGLRVAMMCQAVSTLIASILVGFIIDWKIALCGLALMPIVAVAGIASAKLYSGQAEQDGLTAQAASKIVIEVMNAVRTVVSLHKQQYFFDKFVETLDEHYKITKRKIFCKAFVIGLSLGAPFFSYSIAFLFGGWLISIRALSSGDFFRVVESMVFGAIVVGNTAVLSSDFAKAKIAAINIFKLIDRKPVKLLSEGESTLEGVVHKEPNKRAKGQLAFRGVSFNYPSRPETNILNGLSFNANPGETVALVGASGCGKSTTVQLLEQFYQCTKGKIYLDGTDISSLPVDWVRSQMSLVSQEPVLFSYSIGENIAYGDNSRVVSFEEIVRAAEAANVHSFVSSLPLAYDTPVGGKGSQLSGGQKQRIAIARALLRDPPLLIMDEATSALDTASEKVVQQALDEAARGRTSLVIAHRLKTIQAAQRIVVIDQGCNVEEGTHEELLHRRGHYWRLYNSAITTK